MAPKRLRPLPEEEEGEGSRPPKQFCPLRPWFWGNSFNLRLQMQFERMARRVVREEIQKLPPNPVNKGKVPIYQLQFRNKFEDSFFTFSKIKAKDSMLIQIAIIDKNLQKIVTSDPYSSVIVEIVVLHSDFGNGRDDWNSEEFNGHIVPGQEGKGPLLKGILVIQLVNGVADLTDVTFTGNSSRTSQKKFRLGVRLSRFPQSGIIRNEVQEGISEPFQVKEYRVKALKKHHPPLLVDEVWYLEGISKNGTYCKALKENGVTTVQDLLRCHTIDEAQLRRMFGKESSKPWKAPLKHAKECDLGDKLYSYIAEDKVMLFLNSIYQVVGATFDGYYLPFDKLSLCQQALVGKWKRHAYQNTNSFQLHHKMINNQPIQLHMTEHQYQPEESPNEPSEALPENVYTWQDCPSVQFSESLPEDFFDGLEMLEGETSRLATPLSPGKWVKIIMVLLKWVSAAKHSAASRARFVPPSCQLDDSFGRENMPLSSSLQCQITSDTDYAPKSMTLDQFNWDFTESELLYQPEAPPEGAYTLQDFASIQLSDIRTNSVNSCFTDEFVDGLLCMAEDETSSLVAPLSPRGWVKIMVLVKLVFITKRSAARS
ncbi:protein SAR DEFICIENT 1-like isoform X2 [Typha angustifolia]|uniref:protein SAR DEFICIENT 1-like isoform X2 n=1 Tax=Typha angustifolia TaxID=59011 RepID=UPI003C2E34E6